MTNPTLIGLSGYATSGKDTAAAALLELGWERRAFADKLRASAYGANPVIPHNGINYRLALLVDFYGWDHVKNTYDEAREYLQRHGTQGGRDVLGENVWIDAVMNDLAERTVITDVRFPNEAQAIRDRGGLIVRVHRPGVGPRNAHASETALDNWPFDHILYNDADPGHLHAQVRALATVHVI